MVNFCKESDREEMLLLMFVSPYFVLPVACIPKLNFTWLHCGGLGVDTDTIWNDLHSPSAARMVCISTINFD